MKHSRGSFVVFLLILVALISLATASSIFLYEALKRSSFGRIQNIKIHGLSRLEEEEIKKIIPLSEGMSIWDIKLRDIEDQLRKHPWIEKVSVEWAPTGRIRININILVTEKVPQIILCCSDCFYIDRGGSIITSANRTDRSLPKLNYCPEEPFETEGKPVVPEKVLLKTLNLSAEIKRALPSMKNKVEIEYNSQEEFSIRLENLKILIGSENFENKLEKLQYLLQYLKGINKLPSIRWLDIRYKRWGIVFEQS